MTAYNPQQPQYTPPPGFSTVPPVDPDRATNGDRWGLIAITVAVMTLLACVPGLNCFAPFAPLVAGIIALNQAKQAANPQRARVFGWIATGLGILLIIIIGVVAAVYGAAIYALFREAQTLPELQTAP